MRTHQTVIRIIALMTLVAMAAIGVKSAFAASNCISSAVSSLDLDQQQHDGSHQDERSGVPCRHSAPGGICTMTSLPATRVSFTTLRPVDRVVFVTETPAPRSTSMSAVFHPPRF